VGEVVDPVLVAVTTPVVQAVVPVIDQVAGPVLGLVVIPVVAAVVPVIDHVAIVVAPVVVPVVQPVVGQLTAAVAAPAVALAAPAMRTTTDPEPRSHGLRSTTPITFGAEGGDEIEAMTTLAPAVASAGAAPGVPFRPAVPAQPAVVMAQGGSDTTSRIQRLVAVLSPVGGGPTGRPTARHTTPATAAPAHLGGRPPVTPD
jgi:hypothetical protein